eukprot:491208_1
MGIQYLLTAAKYEKNSVLLKAIKEKAKKYVERAEEIKHNVQSDEISITPHQKTTNTQQHVPIQIPTYPISELLIHGFCRLYGDHIPPEIIHLCITFNCYVSFDQFIQTPDAQFCDIVGAAADDAKRTFRERIILPVRHPDLFSGRRSPINRSIILCGPRGVGKKTLIQAIYNECLQQLTFIHIPTKEIFARHLYGNSPNTWLDKIYKFAFQKAPSIVFFDEFTFKLDYEEDPIDGTCYIPCLEPMNGRVKEGKLVFTVAATTDPWNIDHALRRRCTTRIFMGLPKASNTRKKILEIHLKNIPNTLKGEQWDVLAEKTRGFSGMDIVDMITCIWKEKGKQVELNDFLQRLEHSHFKPSVSDSEIEKHIVWMQNSRADTDTNVLLTMTL